MKIRNKVILSMAVSIIFILSACRKEVNTTTEIFPDGSCLRTVIIEGDSSKIYDPSYPFPQEDSLWTIIFDKKSDPDKLTAFKHFAKVSDLNRELSQKPDSINQVEISVKLEKKFRWFNTIYRYEEIYHTANPFTGPPVSDYLTPEELQLYYIDEDTLDLDDRVDEWYNQATLNEFYVQLIDAVKELNDHEATVDLIESNKDSLFKILKDHNTDDEAGMLQLKQLFGTSTMEKIALPIQKSRKALEKKAEFIFEIPGDFTNHIVMPGLIIDTNANILEGNRVSWKFEPQRFLWEDYAMWVESRVVNTWAMVMTGVICFTLILGLVLGTVICRKRNGA